MIKNADIRLETLNKTKSNQPVSLILRLSNRSVGVDCRIFSILGKLCYEFTILATVFKGQNPHLERAAFPIPPIILHDSPGKMKKTERVRPVQRSC